MGALSVEQRSFPNIWHIWTASVDLFSQRLIFLIGCFGGSRLHLYHMAKSVIAVSGFLLVWMFAVELFHFAYNCFLCGFFFYSNCWIAPLINILAAWLQWPKLCSMSCLIEPNSTSFVQPVESMERLLFLLELWNFHGFITSQLGGINRSWI